MNRQPLALRVLRVAALPLAGAGIGVHLWLGSKIGLAAAALALAAHLAAVLAGRRLLRRRDSVNAGPPAR